MGTLKRIMAARCEHCPLCRYARKHEDTTVGRMIQWHGKFCPFWKAWQEVYGSGANSTGNTDRRGT